MGELFGAKKVPFEKKIKRRIVCNFLLGVAGMTAMMISLLGAANIINIQMDDFTRGFYTGGGAGMFASSIIIAIKNIRLLRDPAQMRKEQIKESDERNIYIGQMTWTYSGYILFIFLYVAMMISGFFSKALLITLVSIGAVFGLIIWIVGYTLRKKYS